MKFGYNYTMEDTSTPTLTGFVRATALLLAFAAFLAALSHLGA